MALMILFAGNLRAQVGNSGTIEGTVTDPSGAAIPNATVTIHNPGQRLDRTAKTDTSGSFSFPNVAFNPYHFTVTAPGFASSRRRMWMCVPTVPVNLKIALTLGSDDRIGNSRGRRRSG